VLILSTMGGSDGMGSIGLLGFIIGPAILAVYTIHILIRDGQTLGKKAMKIRIVNYDDGGNPGFNRVIVMRGIVNGILSSIPFYAFVDVLFIFGSEQRCLHDLIAKTKVVQAAG
ncbi:MAG: RDD family protein, partial [Vicinamibacteria bacterium]